MTMPARARRLATAVAALALLLVSTASAHAAPSAPAPRRDGGRAPVLQAGHPEAVPGRYVVVAYPDAAPAEVGAAVDEARRGGGRIHFRYRHAVRGFAATLPADALSRVRAHPAVAYVEADLPVHAVDTQPNATWGLDRIDQRNLPLNSTYTYNATGSGVKAYIVDTGLRFTHSDFGGRAINGYDAIDGGNADDCNGHGTHVAGTVGGTTWGVAKQVTLVAVRVLNCSGSGTNSQVIAGVDWVTGNHGPGQPAVANMSLGGGASTALDNAVVNSINDGVSYAIAAGNDNTNACNSSPARVAAAITVGSTTSSDARSSFSNYGTCLDLFAPGSSITSAWHTSDTATNTISGTSMATPHVAGVAALYLQGNPSASPATTRDTIVNSATSGVVGNPGSGSPNLLLYSLLTESPPPPPPPSGCSLPESYSGSLAGTGDYDYHPNGTYFYTSRSGTHKGCLRGPASGADFDLYLYKWNGWYWVTVAQGISSTSSEDVTYSGTSGYYLWEVYSYSGSGSYTFGMQRP